MKTRAGEEFLNYVASYDHDPTGGLEVTDWCLFDTKIIYHGQSESDRRLVFFQDADWGMQSICGTNIQIHGMLPNPMSMLVQEIRLFGIAQDMLFTRLRVMIGNKIWMDQPAWTVARASGVRWLPNYPWMIPPLVPFKGDLRWDGKIKLGTGYGGHQLESKPIQLCFIGPIARARQ